MKTAISVQILPKFSLEVITINILKKLATEENQIYYPHLKKTQQN